jgi:hypothetical protein
VRAQDFARCIEDLFPRRFAAGNALVEFLGRT